MGCKIVVVGVLTLLSLFAALTDAYAEVGDVIRTINLPAGHRGISVANDCDGNLYYTNTPFATYLPPWLPPTQYWAKLFKIRISDTYFYPAIDIEYGYGDPLVVETLDWNESGNFLWAMSNNGNLEWCEWNWYGYTFTYRLDPVTGHADVPFECGGG